MDDLTSSVRWFISPNKVAQAVDLSTQVQILRKDNQTNSNEKKIRSPAPLSRQEFEGGKVQQT